MTTSFARSTPAPAFQSLTDRTAKPRRNRTEIWTALLRQTQLAQSRNRSNALAHGHLIVCGGSAEDQHSFLSSLTRPPPQQPLRRNRGEGSEQRDKAALVLSNRYAYGYGHVTLFSAHQSGAGGGGLIGESEEVARLECHCVPEPNEAYEGVLRRLLSPRSEKDASKGEDDGDEGGMSSSSQETAKRLAVTVLLSWREPWKFLSKLRAWLQLLARSLSTPAHTTEDPVDVIKEHGIPVTFVVQHVEAQEMLEREGWSEETFDYVSQVLRTAILPLHPLSALLFTPSNALPQQSGAPLTEAQKVLYTALDFDLAALSPRVSTSNTGSGGVPAKKEDLTPRHNVVDRMNVVVPASWDSIGKIRLLSENFSPEEVLAAWSEDLQHSIFLPPPAAQPESEPSPESPQHSSLTRQHEEVFEADATSSTASSPDLPPSPTKAATSAISAYEAQIVDPSAHKAARSPTIAVVTRPEQDFLKEMKAELDSLATRDRERSAAGNATANGNNGSSTGSSTAASTATRMIGLPGGESTGALDGLGDVSFNVGGVSYNTVSAAAAIERLKRPQAAGPHGQRQQDAPASPTIAGASGGTASNAALTSPGAGAASAVVPAAAAAATPSSSSRMGTPRPPRRAEREHHHSHNQQAGEREREGTPGVASPPSTGKSDFPSEDLEKYFASLAKKAGGGMESRGGTPSRQG